MAGKTAILAIDIVADASEATRGMDDAAGAASRAADKIDAVGGKAGDTATGLGALAGALDAAGFGAAADALGVTATAMDAAEGASILYRVATESLSLSTLKDTATRISNTAATVASTVASKAAQAATKAWAAVQWLLNAAMTANPIGLVIAAVVLLIGVIVVIVSKTTWFQGVWTSAWGAIQAAAGAVWSWIVDKATWAWDLIVSGLRAYIGIYIAIFNGIRDAVGAVWDWIKTAAGSALNAILVPINAVRSAFDRVVDAVRSVIDWLGRIKMPEVLRNIGDTIGGIFGRSAPGAGVASSAPTGLGASSRAMRAGGAGAGVVINVTGALDPVAVARQLRTILRADDRRRGGVVIV